MWYSDNVEEWDGVGVWGKVQWEGTLILTTDSQCMAEANITL